MVKELKINDYLFIIFVAGIGRRIGKLGQVAPKSLLKINDKAILEENIEKLRTLGVQNISLVVGYKKNKIINFLKKFKKTRFTYIKIKNFKKYGHGMTWFATRKLWSKKKKPLIIIHGDIIYDIRYLKNIIKSKKKDLIGISSKKINVNKKKNNWVVKTNKKKQILKVDYIKNFKNYSGEIIGINKISTETANKIFKFMKFFLKKKMKKKIMGICNK